MGDRIALLKDGRLVQLGTAEELYLRPKNIFAAAFFSEINEFPGHVRGGVVETPLGNADGKEFSDGQKVHVAVRLSGLHVMETGGDIPARILSRRFLGVVELLDLAVPGTDRPVRARVRADQLAAGLRDVTLSANQRDILVFEKDG